MLYCNVYLISNICWRLTGTSYYKVMACQFSNISFCHFDTPSSRNLSGSCKGLDEYNSDEELAQEPLFGDYPDELLIFSAACSFIFMTLGIPGNIVTIVALSKYRKVSVNKQ